MTTPIFPDVIDQLAGIVRGSAGDAIRANRAEARLQAQQSYLALFEPAPAPPPEGDAAFTALERFAVAHYVACLHQQATVAAFYAAGLARAGGSPSLAEALAAEAQESLTSGPYGSYPTGPLSQEDVLGPFHVVGPARRAVFGTRLAAALAHAHLLVLHPRDAQAAALQALLDAGWSTTAIVTLSQLVAFLSFQVRVITGLQVLAAALPNANAPLPAARAAATAH
jgi:CMD domain protein